jgi:hypothetical protein
METRMRNDSPDRRRSRRRAAVEAHGIIRARVRPGDEVSLVDVSAGGALIEAGHRMLPGACVELHLRREAADEVVKGRVLRCSVARLCGNAISYLAAVAFDRALAWFAEDASSGYSLPATESRTSASLRVNATHVRS